MTAPAKPDTRPVGEQLTNKVYAFSIEFTYIAIGSILWLICSLPIVTIGAASVGLHALMLGHRMAGRRQYARPFFAAFKASFRLVTLPWLVLLVLMTVFTLDTLFYLSPARRTAINLTLGVIQLVLLAIALVLATYVTALAAIDVDDALSPHCQERRHGRIVHAAVTALCTWPWALAILAVTVAVPALFWWLGVWQFAIFAVGAIVWLSDWLLAKALRDDI